MKRSSHFLYTARIAFLVLCCCSLFCSLSAIRNGSRYFLFLERPVIEGVKKIGAAYAEGFFAIATDAIRNGEGGLGTYDVHGPYELRRLIESTAKLVESQGCTFENPLLEAFPSIRPSVTFPYSVAGKIRTQGVSLGYEQNLFFLEGLSIGAYVPILQVSAHQSFERTGQTASLTQEDEDALDAVRRQVQGILGLEAGDWVDGGLGDMEVFLRYHYDWDRCWPFRSTRFIGRTGFLAPTAAARNLNNPASVHYGLNDHWGYYIEGFAEAELKEGMLLGFWGGALFQSRNTRVSRMPGVGQEPYIFGSVIGPQRWSPGISWKAAGHFRYENIINGLSLQARYSYVRHHRDDFEDLRPLAEQEALATDLSVRTQTSRWSASYLSFLLMYDFEEALKKCPGSPLVFLSFDYPIGWFKADNSLINYFVTLGVKFEF